MTDRAAPARDPDAPPHRRRRLRRPATEKSAAKPSRRKPKLSTRIFNSPVVQRSVAGLAVNYLRLVNATSRLRFDPEDPYGRYIHLAPVIFTMWHGQHFMLPFARIFDFDVRVLISRSRDGEINALVAEKLGVRTIRGSTARDPRRMIEKGGMVGFLEMKEALAEGACVSMTADISNLAARRAGLGIISLAKVSGRAIVPIAYATSRRIDVKSWDRSTINLPFSRAVCAVAEPMTVAADADAAAMEAKRRRAGAAPSTRRPNAPIAWSTATMASWSAAAVLSGYRLFGLAARPVVPLMLATRVRKGKEDPERLAERYGKASLPRPHGPLVWVHAASVGETNAVLPLVERIVAAGFSVVLTTVTVTAAKVAAERLPAGAIHQFAPLDSAPWIGRFLAHWRPDFALFVESEIWPQTIMSLSAAGIPQILVNGRLSERSFVGWKRFAAIADALFSRLTLCLAQSEADGDRYRALGVPEVDRHRQSEVRRAAARRRPEGARRDRRPRSASGRSGSPRAPTTARRR